MVKQRKKTTPPENETNAQKFVRVVEPRVAKALKAIQQIGNCAGIGYEYEDAQTIQIVKVLNTAVDNLALRFNKKLPAQETFKLAK